MSQINLSTRDFGVIPVDTAQFISFPNGIFAFENEKSFALLSPLGEDNHPMWLQSTATPGLCFIVFNPQLMLKDGYNPDIAQSDIEPVSLSSKEDAMYLSIAVIPEDYKKSTVNLKSPIVINTATSTAVQVIVNDDYPIKHPIFDSEKEDA